MPFVKLVKTPSYYKRFQVPLRRRREGRTDYKARRALCRQDKTKYNCPKYRFIVRFTNQRVIVQIAYATLIGDKVIAAADSTELTRFGMPVGHKNYAAAYATGLLCARRVLKQIGMDVACVGVTEATGEEYHIEMEDYEQRPFKCILDIGLVRTTTGHRVFGALKGAIDGGLHIPHSIKRFPGFKKGEDDGSYDAGIHRDRIFAKHVADYMKAMQDEDPDKYEKQFSQYIKNKIDGANLEQKIKELHANIRKDPKRVTKEKKTTYKSVREGNQVITRGKDGSEVKYVRRQKLNKEQRAERVKLKLQKLGEMMGVTQNEE